jgi:hypothetical protein
MKSYIEETLKFIESTEMRNYLRTRTDWLDRNKCAKIISYAPVSLEMKILALELIAELIECNPKHNYEYPAKLVKETRIALDERYNNPLGTVFLLTQRQAMQQDFVTVLNKDIRHFSDYLKDYYLFTTFETAIQYLHTYEEVEDDLDRSDFVWYEIEKWIPGDDGKMEMYCTWILNASGEIWYFNYDRDFDPEDWEELYDYIGNFTLPVPFQPGDIIQVDCHPFVEARRVLIIDVGDNRDCCALQCIYMQPDEIINVCAFNHNTFFSYPERSPVSGHYRAVRYNGELSEHETPLAFISTTIKNNTGLAKEIMNYLRDDFQKHEKDRDHRGIKWEQLRQQFGL